MPIRRYLDGHKFDAETIRVLGIAFEMARVAMRLADRGDLANQVLADKIIELAKAGERDPERLCDGVVVAFRRHHRRCRRLLFCFDQTRSWFGRSTTTPLCGCAGGCASSIRSGDARAGLIHSRTFTGTSGSCA
jgi:hypothetical protein